MPQSKLFPPDFQNGVSRRLPSDLCRTTPGIRVFLASKEQRSVLLLTDSDEIYSGQVIRQ